MFNQFDDFDDDFDVRWWLPSWIPKWLLYAEMQRVASQAKEATELSILDTIKKGVHRAPSYSTILLLKTLWFEPNQFWIYEAFLWKNICDIGWWIWWTGPTLHKSVSKLIIVDPVYQVLNFDILLNKQIVFQDESIKENTSYLLQNPISIPEKYDVAQMEKTNQEMRQVKSDMEWRKNEYTTEKYPHIIKNSSYGEKLEWIWMASQDFVFLNFVITKSTVKYALVVDEINRVLKQGWKLFLSDNFMPINIWEYINERFNIQVVEHSDIRFIALCTKK